MNLIASNRFVVMVRGWSHTYDFNILLRNLAVAGALENAAARTADRIAAWLEQNADDSVEGWMSVLTEAADALRAGAWRTP